MPGDNWQKFANLRLLLGYMYGHPGKKLLFMGGEIGAWEEWNHDKSLDWHLLRDHSHLGIQRWVRDLNRAVSEEKALHQFDFEYRGFEWVDFSDSASSILSFLRKGTEPDDLVLVVCNNTPVPRSDYPVGVPIPGTWRELLNSDASVYGGSGLGNLGIVEATSSPAQGRPYSLRLTLPPLGCLFFKAVSLSGSKT
jgi:1,4-alpha-glucan branching enzyme